MGDGGHVRVRVPVSVRVTTRTSSPGLPDQAARVQKGGIVMSPRADHGDASLCRSHPSPPVVQGERCRRHDAPPFAQRTERSPVTLDTSRGLRRLPRSSSAVPTARCAAYPECRKAPHRTVWGLLRRGARGRVSAPQPVWGFTDASAARGRGVRKAPHRGVGPFGLMGVRRCPTLPPRLQGSTIGAEGLSFRVRNGAGRFPPRYGRRNSMELATLTFPTRGVRPGLGCVGGSGTAQWTRRNNFELVGVVK